MKSGLMIKLKIEQFENLKVAYRYVSNGLPCKIIGSVYDSQVLYSGLTCILLSYL